MQPAPLTGTATLLKKIGSGDNLVIDAARSPHGDSNFRAVVATLTNSMDAARTPHGDSNTSCLLFDHVPRDAARSPHGDSNSVEQMPVTRRVDAARSPHGDKKGGVTQSSV